LHLQVYLENASLSLEEEEEEVEEEEVAMLLHRLLQKHAHTKLNTALMLILSAGVQVVLCKHKLIVIKIVIANGILPQPMSLHRLLQEYAHTKLLKAPMLVLSARVQVVLIQHKLIVMEIVIANGIA